MTAAIGYGGTADTGKLSETASAEASSTQTPVSDQPPRRAGAAPGSQAGAGPDRQPRDQARLIFASFLMLFVELALIRWVTANNVYVTRATNFVLLASFLG